MEETASVRYGRMLEAADIGGYAGVRMFAEAQWLLESGEWKTVGPGFEDPSAFVRSIPLAGFSVPPEVRRAYEQVAASNGATQRAIAESVGVSQPTVQRDLADDSDESEPESDTSSDLQEQQEMILPSDSDESEPESEPEPPKPKHAPVMLTLYTHENEPVGYPQPQGKATFNETSGDGISWAEWSWNPVTGCLHGCTYCYAREIATSTRFEKSFPAGFTPLLHTERMDAPANTKIPAAHRDDPAWRRVFVCSMADLYGRWVPDEWIKQVHESMLASPQWEYLLLTKFPARYVGLDLPPNAWVGTSVDEQKRVRIAENAFRKIDGVKVKWLSLEPLREPLEFADLTMFDWVVIGAQTETRQPDGIVPAFTPPFEWVARLAVQALDAGCAVHLKPNLISHPGMEWLNQYPPT